MVEVVELVRLHKQVESQARVFALNPQEAQASNVVVQGTFPFASRDALVLFDPGASHSFVSTSFTVKLEKQPAYLQYPLFVATPVGERIEVNIVYPSCPVSVQGVDWLAQHYANVDCRKKIVTFRPPGVEPISIQGEKLESLVSMVSAIKDCQLLRKGCQGFLAVVKDIEKKSDQVQDVPVVSEYPDVFSEE
ncbi:uncharacterized protein LOC126661792 [Mercurialis annua]|uniref:uncharacterized protein LOC126661792 n=1 Tax=Mercurialis annua TaxID=3986 RepID=UPI00215E8F6A|nr:uncharacterized protein LOC126661792 [Mercurialis annua]